MTTKNRIRVINHVAKAVLKYEDVMLNRGWFVVLMMEGGDSSDAAYNGGIGNGNILCCPKLKILRLWH